MKILFLAPYIYDKSHSEFSRNKTGFGYMVKDIINQMAQNNNCYLVTHVITKGYIDNYNVLKHSIKDILFHINFYDILIGLKYMIIYKQSLPMRLRYLYYFIDKGFTRNVLKNIKPDLVHIHGATYQTKPYIDLCKEQNIPFVLTLHGANGCSEDNLASIYERKYEKNLLKEFDGTKQIITVVSSGVQEEILKTYQLKGDNVRVIVNGTHISKLVNKKTTDNSTKKILVIGNISYRKNQLQVIEAYDLMPYKFKNNVEIYFCGDNAQKLPIEEKIKLTSNAANLHYMGFVEREKLEMLWECADLNIVASKEEGFGLSIIEGFMHGVPTLTFSDLSVVKDIFSQDSMELVHNRTSKDLAEGMEKALVRSWDSSKIKKHALSFSLETVGEAYEKIYMETIKNYGE